MASIKPQVIELNSFYDEALFLRIFEITDSKATPENYSEGDEILEGYLIAGVPDGDYYTDSRLYKIEGLIAPKIIEIKEDIFPRLIFRIEHGFFENRRIEQIEIDFNIK